MTDTSVIMCTQSQTVFEGAIVSNIVISFGVSIVLTNLLCHRYLLEKAKAMSRL